MTPTQFLISIASTLYAARNPTVQFDPILWKSCLITAQQMISATMKG
jgi:hypothetical protein